MGVKKRLFNIFHFLVKANDRKTLRTPSCQANSSTFRNCIPRSDNVLRNFKLNEIAKEKNQHHRPRFGEHECQLGKDMPLNGVRDKTSSVKTREKEN